MTRSPAVPAAINCTARPAPTRSTGAPIFDFVHYDSAGPGLVVDLGGGPQAGDALRRHVHGCRRRQSASANSDVIHGNRRPATSSMAAARTTRSSAAPATTSFTAARVRMRLNGEAGFDYARYSTAVTVDLAASRRSRRRAGRHVLRRSKGDRLRRGRHDLRDGNPNTLQGRDGADSLYGRGGNDALYGGLAGDALDGGDGFDYAQYDVATARVTVDLGGGPQSGEALDDTFTAIEGVSGSAFDDEIHGNAGTTRPRRQGRRRYALRRQRERRAVRQRGRRFDQRRGRVRFRALTPPW
jgi:hypothetical protein